MNNQNKDNLQIGYHELSPNYGYCIDKLDLNTLNDVSEVVNYIQSDFDKAHSYNNHLAGEIKHEYLTAIMSSNLKNYIMQLVDKLDQYTNYSKKFYMNVSITNTYIHE